jgi:hypothetical protein
VQLAFELIYTRQRERRLALVREAVDIARRTGDRHGLNTGLLAINDPMTLKERRLLSAELRELARNLEDFELEFFAACQATGVLLESGDIRGAEGALQVLQRSARELRQPFYVWRAQIERTMWSIMCGEPNAEQQAFAALKIGTEGGQPEAAMSSASSCS